MPNIAETWKSEAAFGFQLTETARLFREASERFLIAKGLQLTPAEIRTLVHVIRYRGGRQRDIAERMGVEPMTLSAALDRLEEAKLICRNVDAGDRRVRRVVPTEKAFESMRKLQPFFDEFYEQMLRGFTPDELTTFAAGLEILRANLTNDPDILRPVLLEPVSGSG
ncbi:MarR family winged helix-turn-helix transcriptional regulator [Aureimonas sp. AU4]|uniref:MarR family winged helix-turn-helix transcriptional regulator n=1 Tax=Aureimonas sp. AU4 TaxID=1638163 RepID=UPI000782844F|nr:MarR family winged helix-turn-helix transcriptional regulator [Aureimonas sp. AU4]